MAHRAIPILLREFATDTASGQVFTGRGRLILLGDDPKAVEGPVTIGDASLPVETVDLHLDAPPIDLEDPWDGYSSEELRAIFDRDIIYRAEREARRHRRAA